MDGFVLSSGESVAKRIADEQQGIASSAAPQLNRDKIIRWTVYGIVAFVLSISSGVLICWIVSGANRQAAWPSVFVMKSNTAICLILYSIALFGLQRGSKIWRYLTACCVASGLTLSALILSQYIFGSKLGIDELIVTDFAGTRFPGRISPPSCLAFICIGTAIVLAERGRRLMSAQLLFFLSAAAPLSAFGGYLYHAPGLATSTLLPIISFHTAICQLALAVGGLLARPHGGAMKVVMSESLAGTNARRLLPLALFVPIVIGLAITIIERLGILSVPFGSALLVSACSLFFAAAVWRTTSLLWNAEQTKAVADAQRRLAERMAGIGEDRLKVAVATARMGTWDIELPTFKLKVSGQCRDNLV